MSQTETGKALAAEERTEETRSFVRTVKAASRRKYRYSQHRLILGLTFCCQQTNAKEYTSISMLLVYPFVRRIRRLSFPRHTECSPSFQFTAPPLPTTWRSGGNHPRYTE